MQLASLTSVCFILMLLKRNDSASILSDLPTICEGNSSDNCSKACEIIGCLPSAGYCDFGRCKCKYQLCDEGRNV